jgi:hypothetical protein
MNHSPGALLGDFQYGDYNTSGMALLRADLWVKQRPAGCMSGLPGHSNLWDEFYSTGYRLKGN